MEVKTTKALFVFIVCLFTVAVFVFGAGVLTQHISGKKNAQNNFRRIVQATALVFQSETEDAAAVRSGMDAVFAANTNLAAVTVKLNDILVYAQQMSFGFISMNQNNEPAITLSSPMTVTLSAAFTTRDGRHGITTAAFYTIKQQTVYNMARVSFLIILAATMLAILFVIANHALRAPAPKEDRYSDDTEPVRREGRYSRYTAPAPDTEPAEPEPEPAETEMAEDEPPDADVPEEREEDKLDDRLDEGPLLFEDEQPAEDAGAAILPAALLESRLKDELQKAAGLGQDLALFVIVLPDLKRNSGQAAQVLKLIVKHFWFTDHIFEYKADGIAVIVQNSTIDDSLSQAERLYVRLNEALSLHSANPRFGIGVTNRTTRIIPAPRLIKEADEAALRALENPEMPIVALKIDPSKYPRLQDS
jgi:GGDEF domain-containing protein